jgi:ketosteroid isomerase-like protein
MMSQEENLATLRRWADVYEGEGVEGALQIVDEVFAPDVEFSPLLAREVEGRIYRGREEVREFYRELNDMLGMRYAPPEFEPVGEDVIVLSTRMEGAGRESAVPVGHDLALVYEFRDGLVCKSTAYGSRAEAISAAREAQHA